ncbi:hypothetical protein B9Z19DRAFT_1135712 [Tuber borchii]|uniref:Uncharacterized protein n=1 Tax=Tuber borchii TaxID=42251 RepID=A0A2T6ZCG3_TUBBO|nr:hypothetical protein B9Z19DRAFT_1135712 [Tuber borchii]
MEDWTSFDERVQNALLQLRNYVALQKPYQHREAPEEWLQKLLDTGLAEVYCIRAFIRDVVITLPSEISRARNRIAREIGYVKNIERAECPPSTRSHTDDPEASTLRKIKAEAPFGTLETAGERPHPSSVIMARMFEELLPVREVVDIERYDLEAPIELIPAGYVKQYVNHDNNDGHTNIVLLEDPSYNGNRPKKRLAKERPDTPSKLPRDNPIPRGHASPKRPKTQRAAESGHKACGRKDETKNGIELDVTMNTMKNTGEMKARQNTQEVVQQEQIQRGSVNSSAVYQEGISVDINPPYREQDIPDAEQDYKFYRECEVTNCVDPLPVKLVFGENFVR